MPLAHQRLFGHERMGVALGILVIVVVAFLAAFAKAVVRLPPALFQPPAVAAPTHTAERFQARFASHRLDTQTHAATLVELSDGRVRAFWYAGTREGASDVEIRSAVFDPRAGQWGPEQTVASREGTQRALWRFIKKLGNPVAVRAADGTLWLYYVTVSAGGWSGSSITAMASHDDGATWEPARRLITSPFLNVSTLVKGSPFLYADGTIGLPVYHEFATKFGELLRLDRSGAVIDKQRLSAGGFSLQPLVLLRSSIAALALMRYAGSEAPGRVLVARTIDAGQNWTVPTKSSLLNPNAAVAGVALPEGLFLVALNNVEQNRDALSLVVSGDGGVNWKTIYQLEDQRARQPDATQYLKTVTKLVRASDPGVADVTAYAESARHQMCDAQRCDFEFSYPYLIQTQTGDFHLTYTWNRAFIKHVEFNRAWLERRIARASDDKHH